METLRLGTKSPVVERWKNFLRGQELFYGEVNDLYDEDIKEATRKFQEVHHLGMDGNAGNETIGKGMQLGFELIDSPSVDRDGPNWPAAPVDLKPMSQATRQQLFGAFQFKPAPSPGNPEGVQILGSWQKDNITTVEVPQLSGVKYAPSNRRIAWNTKSLAQLLALFTAWEQANLLHLVLTWAGSWNPRFIRGSTTYLSNHAWGTAFDINVPWNGLGARPALVGRQGSVRELVELANQNGFYWGGHFKDRPDGMHFEVARIL